MNTVTYQGVTLKEIRQAYDILYAPKVGMTFNIRRSRISSADLLASQIYTPVTLTPELLEELEPPDGSVDLVGLPEGVEAVRWGHPVRENEATFNGHGLLDGFPHLGLVVRLLPGFKKVYRPERDDWAIVKVFDKPQPVTLFAEDEYQREAIMQYANSMKAGVLYPDKKESA